MSINTPMVPGGGSLPVIHPGPVQNVASGVSAANTTNFTEDAVVRITNKQDCWYKVGVNAVASSSDSSLLYQGVIELIYVKAGERISTIQDTAAGSLNITEAD